MTGAAFVLAVAGCSGVSPTQVGQTAGGIAGGLLAPGIGMPIGALVGTLAGLVVEGQVDKSREKQESAELGQQLATEPGHPATGGVGDGSADSRRLRPTAPANGRPTRVWVDEQVHNGRLLAGHFDARAIP